MRRLSSDLKRALTPALSRPTGEGELQTRSEPERVTVICDVASRALSPIGWERAGVRVSQ